MRSLSNLNIKKSIESKKISYNESWFERFDTAFNYFIFSILMFYSILVFKGLDPLSDNKLEYFFLSCLSGFIIYYIYCKFTEKKLKEIEFTISKEEAKKRILAYGKKYQFRISKISADLIFLNEPTSGFSRWDEEKTIIIFFKDHTILYTLIQKGRKINPPVLFSQYFIRNDFKRILRQTKFELTKKKGYFDRFFNDSY